MPHHLHTKPLAFLPRYYTQSSTLLRSRCPNHLNLSTLQPNHLNLPRLIDFLSFTHLFISVLSTSQVICILPNQTDLRAPTHSQNRILFLIALWIFLAPLLYTPILAKFHHGYRSNYLITIFCNSLYDYSFVALLHYHQHPACTRVFLAWPYWRCSL